jgi:hypothetical protein
MLKQVVHIGTIEFKMLTSSLEQAPRTDEYSRLAGQKFSIYVEPTDLLPCSQKFVTDPYSEPGESSSQPYCLLKLSELSRFGRVKS